jgi:hypothetical protein
MTQLEFLALCGKYLIDPGLAIEDENIKSCLAERDDTELERILREDY